MRLTHLGPPFLALVGAVLLLWPTESEAFTTIGGTLPIERRNVRVFNNFTAATANNNTVPDPNFPGYVGAELAIWKAVAEWGSTLHGDGSGDPVEGLIGSGGANFDVSWQGNSLNVGGPNANIVSQITGGANGVYAFVETPIADGWRMRFFRDRAQGAPWAWQDGPTDEDGGFSRVDIQGIATHEYGHSLGLGHSTILGNTMQGAVSPGLSTIGRSLGGDDIAGVQFLYGVASPFKPTITGVSVSGTQLTITGSNFAATDNEVWFSQRGTTGNGAPVRASNVPSTAGGTIATLTIPSEAGSGNVLIKRPGSSGQVVSNGYPLNLGIDPFGSFCDASDNATALCPCSNPGASDTGCDNADGTGGVKLDVISFLPDGPSATVLCTNLPSGNPTVILLRSSGKRASPVVFGDGVRCLDVPLVRMSTRSSSAGQSAHNFGHGVGPGTFYYQPWYRAASQNFCGTSNEDNFGNGLSILWP